MTTDAIPSTITMIPSAPSGGIAKAAPLATTPEKVGVAVASALHKSASGLDPAVWVPAPLVGLAAVMRLIPRPVWRKLDR